MVTEFDRITTTHAEVSINNRTATTRPILTLHQTKQLLMLKLIPTSSKAPLTKSSNNHDTYEEIDYNFARMVY